MENKPTHLVYHVTGRGEQDNEEKRGFWTKIGAAWPHKDGKGFTVLVETMPLNGRLILRDWEETETEQPVASAEKEEAASLV